MRLLRLLTLATALSSLSVPAQEALPAPVSAAYAATLTLLQSARSPQDVHRMVEAMDTPDWIGIAPTGEKMSRDEAEKQLVALLSIPTGQRPVPIQKLVYATQQGSHLLAVYWVYRTAPQGPVGSIVRDSWSQTPVGWRRSMHEKLFPDRLLTLP
jgi:hypothetical protein